MRCMTAFITRCCRKYSFLCALALLPFVLPGAAYAEGIQAKKAEFSITDSGYVLDAEFTVGLTHTLEEALNKGVALYFVVDFELMRPRWYWFNEKIIDYQQTYRLAYNALTRHYRLAVGNLYQNFATLQEALEFMSRFRRSEETDQGVLRGDATYNAAIRMRLDTSQLPKPFQVSAVGSREWNLSSDWHRWTIGQ
jgi:hypothetical protein